MKAPISFCIITKNEPLLEKCLLSIRDHVKEIVIVDTGSTDGTVEIAKKYADIFEIYTDCNDPKTGLIEDFSQARNRAFELATQPWVGWIDGDDILEGGENLYNLVSPPSNNELNAFMFPYEYSYDESGNCTCRHYRERLFSNKNKVKFVNPVHEVAVPNAGVNPFFIQNDSVIFKHQRQYGNKAPEIGRNLRILRKYFEKHGDSDARQLYYLGLECYNAGLTDEALEILTKYISKSGWADEIVMALLKKCDIYFGRQDYANAIECGYKILSYKETWCEGYFILGKAYYYLASAGGLEEMRNWERCANFIKIGLGFPPTKTLLFINPLDRDIDIHRYYNMALNKIGDIQGALDSANIGLLKSPNDVGLLSNKKIYETFLTKNGANIAINELITKNIISKTSYDLIIKLINNESIEQETKMTLVSESLNKSEWNIPESLSFDSLPLNISDNQFESLIIETWKQFMLQDEVSAAIILLESAPLNKESLSIKSAIKLSKEYLENKDILVKNTNILDIIFYAGNGVENWNPDTVKKTGIGGSELMLMEQAKRFAKMGHKVRVYNSCGTEGVYEGVSYQLTERYQNLVCDVLVVSRRADMLGDQYNISAKLKLLWVHDIYAIRATNELLLKADRILALSEWHKQNLINYHDLNTEHIIVTRNGIDLNRFNKNIKRDQFKCINSSSPDRSWPILLDIWPEIKKQVPQATLHLYYGFKNWEFSAQHDQLQMDLINRLKQQIKNLASLGVVFHDRVNQEDLAKEFLSAGALLYPTWFTETSNISGMEAQAAGLRYISSSIAALNETVGNRGILLDGVWTDKSYQDKFVEETVKALKNNDNSDRLKLQKYAQEHFGLDQLAKDWENLFSQLINDLKANPIIPYQPTKAYR